MKNQEVLDRVIEAQKDFTYERVVNTYNIEVWICKKPQNNHYAFEIIFSRYGIYVNGDINSLIWRVARDLDFLAGGDVDYYIYSKLEAIYQEQREVDPEAVNAHLSSIMIAWLHNGWNASIDEDEQIPWEEYATGVDLQEVVKFYEKHGLNDVFKSEAWNLYDELYDSENSDLRETYEITYKYNGEFETNIDRPSWHVTFSLYMACYAARKIKESN